MTGQGRLKFHCFLEKTMKPIYKARVKVTQFDKLGNYTTTYDDLYTNSMGVTDELIVETPHKTASEDPTLVPYYTYKAEITKVGFRPLIIEGIQVFPNRVALQECRLDYDPNGTNDPEIIKIPAHRQVGKYPDKIPEEPIKTQNKNGTYSVLSKVVVPEEIIVHAGDPNDNSAPNYTVKFTDYIKNVACSELYPTWTDSTLRANIYCILSFTLNRVYTEWYIGKGKNFNITNSTAYDQSFNYGRNISTNIAAIVDELFNNYIQIGTQTQPFLAQYCNGTTVTCPEWLSQWGSQYLGEQGYTPYEILTNYYGDTVNIKEAPQVPGDPKSYPGTALSIGSSGPNVAKKQSQLNAISVNYPLIPKVTVDGKFGPKTQQSVKVYQKTFNLPVTGVIDKATWYSMSNVYDAVKKLAEMVVPGRGIEEGEEFIFYPPVMNQSYGNIPRIKIQ